MENIGIWELLLIMVVMLLLFGASRLPEMGAGLGKGIREFKRSLSETSDAISGGAETGRHQAGPQALGPARPTQERAEPKRLSE